MNPQTLNAALAYARWRFPTGNLTVCAWVQDRDGIVNSWVDVDSFGTSARGKCLPEALDALEAKLSPATLDSAIKAAEIAVQNAQNQLQAYRNKRLELEIVELEIEEAKRKDAQ